MKHFLLIIFTLLFCGSLKGQSIFNGFVSSLEDSLPIAGATVKVKETGYVTVTNEHGRFSFNFNGQRVTIEINRIGFTSLTKEFVISKDIVLNIGLVKAIKYLDEVVVSTGYQAIPKERATGSFTTIDNKTFNQQISTDVLSRLEASANGLTVDRGTTPVPRVTIRGLSTIRGPKDALIVVDNFPYDGDINNLNPNDVESVTILKDAAASSIWGAKAGNGVVVITTKKGRPNQPLTIDFNSNITIGDKPDLSYLRQMSSSDFIDVEQMLYSKGYYTDWINSANKRVLSNVVEILKKNPADATSQINSLRKIDVRDDFNKYFYQKSVNQQYALSLLGGTNVMNWRASAGYDNNLSNLDANYERLTLRIQNVYKPIKNLQIIGGINYTKSNQKSGNPGYGSIIQGGTILPYAQFADQNGNSLPIVKGHSQSYLETAGNGKLLDWKYYPLEDYKNTPSTNNIQDIVINAGANYMFFPGLDFDVKYQYERQSMANESLFEQGSYYARDLVNSFTQIDGTGAVINIIPRGGILDFSNGTLNSNNFRGQLNFHKTWLKHDVSAIGGSEFRRANTIGNTSRIYGYNNDILSFGTVDYRNTYPDFISGNLYYIPDATSVSDTRTNFISTYANAAYTYNQKYILSLSGRRDASNLFGLNINDQWNPFWSTGLSWIVSNESFFQNKLVPFLKIRTTYGFSGNIDPSMSAVTTIQYVTNSPYTLTPYSRFINYFNPDLKWETSKMLNIGLDFKTMGDIITGSIEYYQKKGNNLFGEALIDYTAGIGNSIIKNVASMKGEGVDVELKSLNLRGDLKWQTNLNFSYYKDKVTDYYLSSTQASNFVSSNVPISGVVGKPVYSIFGYKWAGLDPLTGDPQGYANGVISKDYSLLTGSTAGVQDLKYFGSALPVFFGSLGNTVSFKEISVNFSFVYKLGYYFRKRSINYSSLFTNWNGNSDYAMRWQNPGDEQSTNVPSMVYPAVPARDSFYQGSEVLIEKGDHIRLQYINLSYNLNNARWKQMPFKSLQLYFNATNLGIIWRANKSGIDPDYNYTANSLPNTRSFSIGLRANLK